MEKLSYELGPIRPPSEAVSLLIRLTRNCPWNKCAFCPVYKGQDFSLRTVDEIKRDIDNIKKISDLLKESSWQLGYGGLVSTDLAYETSCLYPDKVDLNSAVAVALWMANGPCEVFFQDANSLVMKTDDLIEVLRYLKTVFPEVLRITSYARAHTVAHKRLDDLIRLKEAGLNRIHIGLESGSDQVLSMMCKGATAQQQVEAGMKVRVAGIELSEYIMPGLGGKLLSDENATETARVLNKINPHFIRIRSFVPLPHTPVQELIENNQLILLGEDDVVREIRSIIEQLEDINSFVYSDHIMNLLERVEGKLPGDKEKMISVIDEYLSLPEDQRHLFKVGRRLGYYRDINDRRYTGYPVNIHKVLKMIKQQYGDIDTGIREILARYI